MSIAGSVGTSKTRKDSRDIGIHNVAIHDTYRPKHGLIIGPNGMVEAVHGNFYEKAKELYAEDIKGCE